MSLSDLPTEITLLVLDCVAPDDIISFCTSCHHMYDRATGVLARHKDLTLRYRNIDVYLQEKSLLEFVENPEKALYVKDVFVHDSPSRTRPVLSWSELEAHIHELARKVQCNPAERRCLPVPFATHSQEPCDTAIALSLFIFRNLASMTIDIGRRNGRLPCTKELINRITAKGKFNLLRKFSKITINPDRRFFRNTGTFDKFAPFMKLPNIRTLSGRDLDACCVPPDRSETGLCAATELNLKDSHISNVELEEIFQRFKALKVFEYTHHRSLAFCYCTEETRSYPPPMYQSLLKYAQHSLNKLSIDVNLKEPGLSFLREFSALGSLSLNVTALRDTEDRLVRLVDILPPSVERFRILGWEGGIFYPNTDEGFQLLFDLPARQKSLTPLLREISLEINGAQTMIDCRTESQTSPRTESELRRAYISYGKSYRPGETDPLCYTLLEYIVWLSYRKRCPKHFAVEQYQWMPAATA